MVLKLWSGAQSAFVRLVTSRDEAARWIARLFSDGVYDLSDRSVCRLGMDFLKKQPSVDPGRIAAVGYCFGGGVALNMARQG